MNESRGAAHEAEAKYAKEAQAHEAHDGHEAHASHAYCMIACDVHRECAGKVMVRPPCRNVCERPVHSTLASVVRLMWCSVGARVRGWEVGSESALH